MHKTLIRRLATVTVAMAAMSVMVACSDDGDDEKGAEADSGVEAACAAYVALPEEIPEDGKVEDRAAIDELLSDFEDGVPEDSAADAGELVSQLRASLDEGTELGEETFTLYGEIGGALVDACPSDEKLDVTARDYFFEDMPTEVDAGKVNVRFTNGTEGDEQHEMVVIRRKQGVTLSFADIIDLEEEEFEASAEDIGFGFATPGTTSGLFLDLEAGDYAAVCFVPVGGEDGAPTHASKGMLHEFTVS